MDNELDFGVVSIFWFLGVFVVVLCLRVMFGWCGIVNVMCEVWDFIFVGLSVYFLFEWRSCWDFLLLYY